MDQIEANNNRIDFSIHGKDMVNQRYELTKNNVCYSQFNPEYFVTDDILNPEESTFEDLKIHFKAVQDLCDEGIKSIIRLLKKMEEHPYAKVDFNHPTPKQFNDYIKACKVYGDYNRSRTCLVPVTKIALNNRCKAWYNCLVAWGVDKLWPIPKIKKIPNRVKSIHVPLPEDIWNLTHYKYETDRDITRWIQYHFWFGAITGLAPEKEWCIVDLDNTRFDESNRFHLEGVRPKVDYNTRTIVFEEIFSKSSNCMNFYNLLNLRNKFADKDETALLVNPNTGKRWTERQLYRFLTKYGKMVYPDFYPYILRHFCATARMIENGINEYALTKVCNWLGHEDIKRTKTYLDLAMMFKDTKGNWVNRAFKRPYVGRLHEDLKTQQTVNKAFSEQNSIEKCKRICRDLNPG